MNVYDPSGKRVYIVNPEAGILDVIDITAPTSPVKAPSLDIVAACETALGISRVPIRSRDPAKQRGDLRAT